MKRFILRTANSAAMRLSALITGNAQNIAAVNDGEWYVIAPLGEHPSPDGSYTQVLTREQAEKVLRTWNSIPGTAARMFKNMWHGLGAKFSAPVFDGHPDSNNQQWPIARLLAETTDLRVTENALEGRQTWNSQGMQRRTRGPLYPSPLWWHLPPNDERKVFPELLESIGLVPTPNIASVPAWTQNASPDAQLEQANQNQMDRTKLIKALGLGADATDDQIIAAVEERSRTANAAIDRTKLIQILGLGADATNEQIIEKATGVRSTANAAPDRSNLIVIAGLKPEATNDQILEALRTMNSRAATVDVLTTANTALVDGVLDLLELAGKVTPADKPTVKQRFTANGAKPGEIITELKDKKPAMNTKTIELNGNRVDLSTANARQTALESAIAKRMADDKCDRGAAYDRVKADPAFKQLFESMSDPTKQKQAA